ncbi:MAG: MFS transporter [Chloroflexota bacterium]|nr:MFS transporter [Chloroflexota bacterium]
MFRSLRTRLFRSTGAFVALALAIEFYDEIIDGVGRISITFIRDDLNLSYGQIGLLVGIPTILAAFIEPFIGIAGDTKRRAALVIGGTALYALSMALMGISWSFIPLVMATCLYFPAAGASVGLTQASLMDADPARRENNMARWELAGSLGNVAGPIVMAVAVWLVSGNTSVAWRALYVVIGLAGFALTLWTYRLRDFYRPEDAPEDINLIAGVREALRQLRRGIVLRWVFLLDAADLLMDIFRGFLALYFVDVVRTDEGVAGIALLIFTGVGLIGDVVLIPLLERVRGLTYIRWSVAAALVLYPAFLLAEPLPLKLVLLGLLGMTNAGWYSILQAQLYAAVPARSGSVMALSSITSLVSGLIPTALGFIAGRIGLGAMMWLLLLAPIALLIGIPRRGVFYDLDSDESDDETDTPAVASESADAILNGYN